MTLVVEDGTGISNAESYVSVSEIDAYAEKFGKSGWIGVQTLDKEIHARRATQFLDSKYPFDVTSKVATQALVFPAESFYIRGHSVTGIPLQLKDAACELAIISVGSDLVESVGARAYTYRSVKIGDLEKTERYSSSDNQNIFYSVELILRPLLANSIGRGVSVVKLRRA